MVPQQRETQVARQQPEEEEGSFLKELVCEYQVGPDGESRDARKGGWDKETKRNGRPAFLRPATGATAPVSGAEFFRRGPNKESTNNKDTANILATRAQDATNSFDGGKRSARQS